MSALAVDIGTEDDQLLVAIRGELDAATIPELRRRMVEVRRREAQSVVIDAAGLAFVGVRGMHALTTELRALRKSRREVSIVNARPQVRRLAGLLFAQAQLGPPSAPERS